MTGDKENYGSLIDQDDSRGPKFAKLDGKRSVIGLVVHGSLYSDYGEVAFNTLVASHELLICPYSMKSAPI
jgi:hypothetical protein